MEDSKEGSWGRVGAGRAAHLPPLWSEGREEGEAERGRMRESEGLGWGSDVGGGVEAGAKSEGGGG